MTRLEKLDNYVGKLLIKLRDYQLKTDPLGRGPTKLTFEEYQQKYSMDKGLQKYRKFVKNTNKKQDKLLSSILDKISSLVREEQDAHKS